MDSTQFSILHLGIGGVPVRITGTGRPSASTSGPSNYPSVSETRSRPKLKLESLRLSPSRSILADTVAQGTSSRMGFDTIKAEIFNSIPVSTANDTSL